MEDEFVTPKTAKEGSKAVNLDISDDDASSNNDNNEELFPPNQESDIGTVDNEVQQTSLVREDVNLQQLLLTSPKSTNLIMENRANESKMPGLAWTYKGSLGILDDDTIFYNEIVYYSDYYEVLLNQYGPRNVPDNKLYERN